MARALATAHGILPDQGPIGVFIHHNTLHAFQHLPFHEGVQAGAAALGAKPYPSLREFRDAVRANRVSASDVRLEIDRALGARGMTIYHFADGRIVGHQQVVDRLSVAQQLGLLG